MAPSLQRHSEGAVAEDWLSALLRIVEGAFDIWRAPTGVQGGDMYKCPPLSLNTPVSLRDLFWSHLGSATTFQTSIFDPARQIVAHPEESYRICRCQNTRKDGEFLFKRRFDVYKSLPDARSLLGSAGDLQAGPNSILHSRLWLIQRSHDESNDA